MIDLVEESERGSLLLDAFMEMDQEDEGFEEVFEEVDRIFTVICGTPARHPWEAERKMAFAIKYAALLEGEDHPLVLLLHSVSNDQLAFAALVCDDASETRH